MVGVDTGHSTIPQETGLVPVAVDLEKGCFLGQELVGRIARRGHVNKHLRVLEVRWAGGSGRRRSEHGEVTVGTVTSVAGPVGLATLRREVEVGESVIGGWVEWRWSPADLRCRRRDSNPHGVSPNGV